MRDFVFSSFLVIAIFALTPAALAAHGEDTPFGTFLTEGDSSNARERFADEESHFQETVVDQAADEDSLDSINRIYDEGEDPTAYDTAMKWLETHFKSTVTSIRDIADVLERAADVAKNAEGLQNHLRDNLRKGLPVPRPIWGVTVFDLSSSRNTAGLRAASDKQLGDFRLESHPGVFEGQLMELDAVLKTYANPKTLFRRANGDLASMGDVNLDPGTGALHACVHFLRELSIVRQLAQVAFPNIEIAEVPPLASCRRSPGHRVWGRHQEMVQGRAPYSIELPDDLLSSRSLGMGGAYEPQGSATTAIDISARVVRWVRSLADNVHTGFVRILKTERSSSKKDQINNEKLIERVKNANMMVQALKLYTSGVRFYTDGINDKATLLWGLTLRVSAQETTVRVYAEHLYQLYDDTMDNLDQMIKFWDGNKAEEDTDEGAFDAIDSFPNEGEDDLAISRIMTEGDLAHNDELLIHFENRKLARLLAHEFKRRPKSDEQIREAVNQRNGKQLFFLVSCPICLDFLHSETLVTLRCGHEIDKKCFERWNNGCPICRDGGPHGNTKVTTLLKKLLELFEDEGVIPKCLDVASDDLAVSPIITEDELAGNDELRIHFNNRKLATLLAREFETRPKSDGQIRKAVNQKNGQQLYIMVSCPRCKKFMHSETLATLSCGHAIHEECLTQAEDVCPICGREGPHENTKVETLLKKLLELFEIEGVIPKPKNHPALVRAMKFLEIYFKETVDIIKDIADALKKPADVAKHDQNVGEFQSKLRWKYLNEEPVPRAILGVTADSSNPVDTWAYSPTGVRYDPNEYRREVQRMEFVGLCLTYNNPDALFRRANGDFASMDDVKPDPEAGARHARVHFLRELSIVRQLAQVAFPNIEIAHVPPLASTAEDISESVVRWVGSLADNVLTGLDQILQTESLSSNKEKLIERVQNANMMMQALILYTSGVSRDTYFLNEASALLLQLVLRRPANTAYVEALAAFLEPPNDSDDEL